MPRKKKTQESSRSQVARALNHSFAGSSWATENVHVTPTGNSYDSSTMDSQNWIATLLATIRPCQPDEVELLQNATRDRGLDCRAELDSDTSSIQVTCKEDDLEKITDVFQRLIDNELHSEHVATTSHSPSRGKPLAKTRNHQESTPSQYFEAKGTTNSRADRAKQKQLMNAVPDPEEPKDEEYAFW